MTTGVYVLAVLLATGVGALASGLYPVAIGVLTLVPVASHARHVGLKNVFSEPTAITVIVWFYFLVFPLRGLAVALNHLNDLQFAHGPVTPSDLVSMLLLASLATTLLVEAYYLARPGRLTQPPVRSEPSDRHHAVVRFAAIVSGIALVGLAGVVAQHGGLSGARAAFVQHDVTAALHGNSSIFGSAWQLFAVPAVWACAYILFNVGSSFRARCGFALCGILIVASALGIYSSRLNTLLGLLGVWVVYFYSGRRIPGRVVLIALAVGMVVSVPILATRSSRTFAAGVSKTERYSRIAGYGVLDVALAIQSRPEQIRAQLQNANRWLDLPAYLVPSKLWHGRPNLNTRRLVLYVAQDIGNANDQTSGFPATEIMEGWLLGGWLGAILLSIGFGLALGFAVRRLTRLRSPGPAAILALAFVLTTGWGYYDGGDVVTTVVGQGKTAVYLALLLWVTNVIGQKRSNRYSRYEVALGPVGKAST